MSSLKSSSPGALEEEETNSELFTGLLAERHNDSGTLESALFNSRDDDYDDDEPEEGMNDTISSYEAGAFISPSGCCSNCGKDGCRREPCEKCKELLCLDCIVKYRKGGRILYLCGECAAHYRKWRIRKIIIAISVVVLAGIISLVVYVSTKK